METVEREYAFSLSANQSEGDTERELAQFPDVKKVRARRTVAREWIFMHGSGTAMPPLDVSGLKGSATV